MKIIGTIIQIFHNEKSSKLKVDSDPRDFLINQRDRRDFQKGDYVSFNDSDKTFGKSVSASDCRKEQAPEKAPAAPAASSSSGSGAAPSSYAAKADSKDARITMLSCMSTAVALVNASVTDQSLALPKKADAAFDAKVAAVKRVARELFALANDPASDAPASSASSSSNAPAGKAEGSSLGDLPAE